MSLITKSINMADSASLPNSQPLHERRSIRQFVKFCIVGASSTVISFGIFNILYLKFAFPLVPAVTIAFLLAVINGFMWNRHWTFKEAKHKSAREQYMKFLAVNVVGWFLNTSIVVLIVAHFTSGGHGIFGDQHQFLSVVWAIVAGQHSGFNKWLVNGALAAATCVVVFWNFFANRLWTFKH
jgi:putative flippase GtrA